jgi:hypothetical protein
MTSDDLFTIELDRVHQALRQEKFKRRLLKIIILILRKFRSTFPTVLKYKNNAGMGSAITDLITINRFYHPSDSLNNFIEKLVICSNDWIVFKDIQRQFLAYHF